jgi:hypothetical protein
VDIGQGKVKVLKARGDLASTRGDPVGRDIEPFVGPSPVEELREGNRHAADSAPDIEDGLAGFEAPELGEVAKELLSHRSEVARPNEYHPLGRD